MIAVLAFAAVTVFAQIGGPSIMPPVESHTTVTNNLVVPPMDPQVVAETSVQSSQAVMTMVIAPAPLQWTNELLNLPVDIFRTTPDDLTWNNGAIRGLADLIRTVAMALIVLFILAKGIAVALGRDDPSSLGRLFYAALLSTGNLIFWQIGVQLNNAITAAIAAPALPSLIRPHLVAEIDPASTPGTVILLVVYAIVALLLMFSLLFRLGLIDILIAVGSLALICKAIPETDHIATHYTRISVAVLFSQILIVICLRCASVLATLGTGGVLGTLVSIAILWLARSAPQQILAGSSNSQGNHWGSFAARLIARRLGR